LNVDIPVDATLADLAGIINKHLKTSERPDPKKRKAHRLLAAFVLRVARPKAEREGWEWEAWCKENVDRSIRDVYRLLALVEEPGEAEAKLNEERKATRKRMKKLRASPDAQTDVRQVELPPDGEDDDPVERLFAEARRLSPEQFKLFAWKVKEYCVTQYEDLPGPAWQAPPNGNVSRYTDAGRD
jgi:hypothetical protein